MSDALEEMCDALKAGQCIGDPRADGIDRATLRADRSEWLNRYRVGRQPQDLPVPRELAGAKARDITPPTSKGPPR